MDNGCGVDIIGVICSCSRGFCWSCSVWYISSCWFRLIVCSLCFFWYSYFLLTCSWQWFIDYIKVMYLFGTLNLLEGVVDTLDFLLLKKSDWESVLCFLFWLIVWDSLYFNVFFCFTDKSVLLIKYWVWLGQRTSVCVQYLTGKKKKRKYIK